mmetsp:Transcript_71663/g.171281  ORF Transcript_71663/g.171281 Transcript_71663/m.171281 type:complete len:232 (+) Transcript_71663:316-1011(+)
MVDSSCGTSVEATVVHVSGSLPSRPTQRAKSRADTVNTLTSCLLWTSAFTFSFLTRAASNLEEVRVNRPGLSRITSSLAMSSAFVHMYATRPLGWSRTALASHSCEARSVLARSIRLQMQTKSALLYCCFAILSRMTFASPKPGKSTNRMPPDSTGQGPATEAHFTRGHSCPVSRRSLEHTSHCMRSVRSSCGSFAWNSFSCPFFSSAGMLWKLSLQELESGQSRWKDLVP